MRSDDLALCGVCGRVSVERTKGEARRRREKLEALQKQIRLRVAGQVRRWTRTASVTETELL